MKNPSLSFKVQAPSRYIELPEHQSEVFSLFYENRLKFLSYFDFCEIGIADPAIAIKEMADAGAIFHFIVAPGFCDEGHEHEQVAWYMYEGWR